MAKKAGKAVAVRAVLPSAGQLKLKFMAQKVPREVDFAMLIELANGAPMALGLTTSEGNEGPGLGAGLVMDAEQRVCVGTGDGVMVSDNAVSVNVNASGGIVAPSTGLAINGPGAGLVLETNQLRVGQGDGIMVAADGISAKADTAKGISVGASGIGINAGVGLDFATNQLKVGQGNGITVAASTISAKANTAQGITVTADGIGMNVGTGLGFESNKLISTVNAQNVFSRGMIIMFSGGASAIPAGWFLCDGTNGTPNLIGRFIVGGSAGPGSGTSTTLPASGKLTASCSSAAVTVTTTNAPVALDVNQMPQHDHAGGEPYSAVVYGDSPRPEDRTAGTISLYGATEAPAGTAVLSAFGVPVQGRASTVARQKLNTSKSGGSATHTHTATSTTAPHTHTVETSMPYYQIAFIMKA